MVECKKCGSKHVVYLPYIIKYRYICQDCGFITVCEIEKGWNG